MHMKRILITLLLLPGVVLGAGETESLQRIRSEVHSFLTREALGLPGQPQIEVGAIDARLRLARCDFLQTFFPAGSRAWGKTSVGVRCAGANPWTVYVPARVGVSGTFLVATRGLEPGQTVQEDDLIARSGDLTKLPEGTLTDPIQVRGRVAARRVAAGQPLQKSMLRAENLVRNGQLVGLVAQGKGFRITSEGRVIGDAAEGSLVHVRTASGKIVSGIVRAGPFIEVML